MWKLLWTILNNETGAINYGNKVKKAQKDGHKAVEDYMKEAREEQLRAQRTQAIGSAVQGVGAAFGDPSGLESDQAFENISSFQGVTAGVGVGASLLAAGAGMAWAGPVGVAVAGISILSSRSKRRAAKEAAKRRWRKALAEYKQKVTQQKRQLESAEKKVHKAIGEGVQLDILKQAQADVGVAQALQRQTRGAKAVTAERAVDSVEEGLFDLVQETDAKLLTRIDMLEDAQFLAQKELDARRSELGAIRTDVAKDLEAKVREIEDL